MVQRQPADDHVIGVEIDTEAVTDQQFIGDQIAMTYLNAFGQGGGTGGVLQERDIVAAQDRTLPAFGDGAVEGVDTQQLRGIGCRQFIHLQQGRTQVGAGQQQTRFGIGDDRQQTLLVMTTIGFRRIGRYCNHTGIQTAKEGRHVVRPAMEQQNGPVTRLGPGLQRGGDGPGTQIQITVGQHDALIFFVSEKTQGQTLRRLRGATLKGLCQGIGEFKRIHDEVPAVFGLPNEVWISRKGARCQAQTRVRQSGDQPAARAICRAAPLRQRVRCCSA
ncbi:hypothetical protein PSCICE_05300 [Pseudomonas cichorii]|nr:hypothetical protein PSCICE_05300 [Pseudomonas cichorii]